MQSIKKYYKKYWKEEPTTTLDFILYKATCSAICTGYSLKHRKILAETKKTLSKAAAINTKEKRSVFVFANGPSLIDIDLTKISELQAKGTHDVIALNSFLSKSGQELKPDYAVFADSVHFAQNINDTKKNEQYISDIEYCQKNNVKTLVPAEYYNAVELDSKLAFCTISNIYGKNTNTICKPVGFYRLTALYALVLAKELGYHNIYIAGFDNSYFKNFEVTPDGECILRHTHYYDKTSENTTVRPLYNSTVPIFYDFYKHFYFIEKITKNDPRISNIARKTYISSIPTNNSLDIYKKHDE